MLKQCDVVKLLNPTFSKHQLIVTASRQKAMLPPDHINLQMVRPILKFLGINVLHVKVIKDCNSYCCMMPVRLVPYLAHALSMQLLNCLTVVSVKFQLT